MSDTVVKTEPVKADYEENNTQKLAKEKALEELKKQTPGTNQQLAGDNSPQVQSVVSPRIIVNNYPSQTKKKKKN